MENKRKKIIYGIFLVIAIAVMLASVWLVGKPLVSFAGDPAKFRQWVDGHGLTGRIVYCGMVVVQIVIALIPGEVFELLAGYAFGAVEGTLLCLAASTVGSMAVFYLVRKFGIKIAEVFFSREKLDSVKFLKSSEKKDVLFFFVFMIPGTPKDLLCYFAGLTDISPLKWLIICAVGRIPAIITSTVGGDAIGSENYLYAVIVFAVTAVVSLAGLLIYKKIPEKKSKKQGNEKG